MSTMRSLEELIAVDDPALPELERWLASATNEVERLAVDRADGERTLVALQVTARSPMGALALHTGGLRIDGGWLRVLGGGGALRRDLASWNRLDAAEPRLPGAMLVADDAVGGFFAINGGALPGAPGNIVYLAPDTLSWEDMQRGYSDWLHWALHGDLARYYESMRWPGWRDEIATLAGDVGVSVYPPLWAAGEPVAQRSRSAVPIEELWSLHAIEFPRQLSRR